MYGFIITTAGEGLLARASAGEGLTITEVWVGKGTVESAAAAKALTALLDPVAQATSTQPEVAGGQLSMLVEYRNDMGGGLEEGFTLSEFGVMAKVGDDAPTLLYYAALGDPAQPVPPIAEGLDVHRFPVAIGVTGEVEVSLEYPAGVWVTHEELEEALAGIDLSGYVKSSEKGAPNGVATLGQDGKLPPSELPPMDYDPAGSAAAVQQALTAHTGNKNNPHAVTAEQVGASRAVKGTYPVAAGQIIQAGDVVDVVEGKVQKSAMPVENVETVFDNVATLGTSVLRLSDNLNVVCYLYQNGSTHWPCVHLVDDTGKVVGQTNRQVIENVHASNIMAARLSDTQFVVGYIENYTIKVNIGTANGSSITFGSSTVLESGGVTCISIVAISTNRVLITRNFGGSNEIRAGVYSVTGNKIENIGASIALPGITRADNISTTLLSNNSGGNNRVCVCFCDGADGSKGKAAIITVDSSNAVTWGNVVTFEGSQTLTPDVCVSGSDAIVFFRTTYTSSTVANQHVRLLKVSNNVISLPNEKKTIWNRGSGNAENPISISQVGEKYVCLIPPGNSTYRSPAIVVSRNADTLEPGETFQFSKSIAKALSACAISDNNLIVAYADAGNLNYGTVTTLTVYGNQIAGGLVDGSQDAIALQGGTAEQSIEVIYSGTVAADWVTDGQVISSPGVYGAGVLDGVLQVWSKERPGQAVTGRYVGTGAYGRDNPNSLTFPQPPKMVVCVQEFSDYAGGDNYGFTWVGNIGGTAQGTKIFSLSGNTLSWYNDSEAKQANQKGRTYYYTAIF